MAIDVVVHVLEASFQFGSQIFVGGELPELWQNEAFVCSLELSRHWVIVDAGSAFAGELKVSQKLRLSLQFRLKNEAFPEIRRTLETSALQTHQVLPVFQEDLLACLYRFDDEDVTSVVNEG
jgi:hypothetical protein